MHELQHCRARNTAIENNHKTRQCHLNIKPFGKYLLSKHISEDADDFWLPNKLEYVYKYLNNDGDIDLICHNEYKFRDNRIIGAYNYGYFHTFIDLLVIGNCLSPSAVVMKKNIFKVELKACN